MSSTIYTMGTALNRARDNHVLVSLLVDGHWMQGHVVAIDGHGVVLERDGVTHSVVRLERVSAVEVMAPAPHPSTTLPRPDADTQPEGSETPGEVEWPGSVGPTPETRIEDQDPAPAGSTRPEGSETPGEVAWPGGVGPKPETRIGDPERDVQPVETRFRVTVS